MPEHRCGVKDYFPRNLIFFEEFNVGCLICATVVERPSVCSRPQKSKVSDRFPADAQSR
jgi:hypothetical protein